MATERQEPDVLIASNGLTGVVSDIQADPDTKSGGWTGGDPLRATGNNTDTDFHCSFPSPSGDLNTGAGLQEFRVLLRPFDSGQTGDPDWRIELWEFEASIWSLVRAGSNTEILNDAGDTVVAFTWDASELTTVSGANVGIKVFGIKTGGSPGKRNTIDFGAVEWNVDFAAAGNVTGSGSPQADTATASGAGVNKNLGSGSPQADTATSTGAAVGANKASGSPTANTATVSGAGVNKNLGSGIPQADTATASGTGIVPIQGSGSPTADTATASGTGIVPIQGSGSPQADTATSLGVGVNKNFGSGSPQADVATAAGAGVNKNLGSGTPQADIATASGAGVNKDSGFGTVQAETATASGSGSVGGGGTPLVGIPAGFYTIPNCLKDPDFLLEMRKEAQATGVWCKWIAGVDLPVNPLPKGSANFDMDISLVQNEANDLAVWARWAPGTQPGNTGNLQLDMVAALNANFVLSS